MNIALHKRARTTPAVRREIQQSKLSERKLAEKYGISRSTVRKWKYRDTAEDFSHRPHNLHATLTDPEEAVVAELRKTLLLPIDDLLVVVREFICPHMSRSALDRCLRRHGVSNLKELIPAEKNEKNPPKTFKDYEPGFVHADIKYLPRMPDETDRKYLFVGIDRATRWVYNSSCHLQHGDSRSDSYSTSKKYTERKKQHVGFIGSNLTTDIEQDVYNMAYELELKYDCVIDVILLSDSAVRTHADYLPIYRNILREGVRL
jgi:transposase